MLGPFYTSKSVPVLHFHVISSSLHEKLPKMRQEGGAGVYSRDEDDDEGGPVVGDEDDDEASVVVSSDLNQGGL